MWTNEWNKNTSQYYRTVLHPTLITYQHLLMMKCFFCGYSRNPRYKCPAREAICKVCSKKGHFLSVCRLRRTRNTAVILNLPSQSTLASMHTMAALDCLSLALISITVKDIPLKALIDTGSSDSYISQSVVEEHQWITLAFLKVHIDGFYTIV